MSVYTRSDQSKVRWPLLKARFNVFFLVNIVVGFFAKGWRALSTPLETAGVRRARRCFASLTLCDFS